MKHGNQVQRMRHFAGQTMLQCAIVDIDAQPIACIGGVAFMRFNAFGFESQCVQQINELATARANV